MRITMSAARAATSSDANEVTFKALVEAVKPWAAKRLSTEDEAKHDGFYEGTLKPDSMAKVIKYLLKEGFTRGRAIPYKKGKVHVVLSPDSIYFNIEGYGE